MKVVAFIPIKLNNQRLPGKNLKPLAGKPLCRYIFDTVADIDVIDERYCYCSDEEIQNYLPEKVKFLKREKRLDANEVKGLEIIEAFVRDVYADVYIIAHATQPFTKKESVRKAVEEVVGGGFDSAFSALPLQDYLWYKGKPFNYEPSDIIRTQDMEPVYMETGAFFAFRREVFTEHGRRIGLSPYFVEVGEIEAVDIDVMEDFMIAEAIMNSKKASEGED